MGKIPVENIYAMIVTLLTSCLFPIILWIILAQKRKRLSGTVIAGVMGFVLFQMIIRIPLLQLLAKNQRWLSFFENNIMLAIVILALSAALFETAGRLLVLKGILRNRLSFNAALGAGLGHGGAESVGIVGLTYVNNLIFSFLINTGMLPSLEGAEEIQYALMNTPASVFFAAGVERVLAIAFHIALSVLLCYFIMKGRTLLGSALCIGIHFAFDIAVSLTAKNEWPVWAIEGVIAAVAVAAVLLVIRLKSLFSIEEIPKDSAETAVEQGY